MTGRQAQIRFIQGKLEKKHEQLLEDLTLEMNAGLAKEDRHLSDPSDMAAACTEESVIAETVDIESHDLQKVEAALEKIRRGVFGLCEECGTRIKIARLRALPFTPYCLECQENAEREAPDESSEGAQMWDAVQDPE